MILTSEVSRIMLATIALRPSLSTADEIAFTTFQSLVLPPLEWFCLRLVCSLSLAPTTSPLAGVGFSFDGTGIRFRELGFDFLEVSDKALFHSRGFLGIFCGEVAFFAEVFGEVKEFCFASFEKMDGFEPV